MERAASCWLGTWRDPASGRPSWSAGLRRDAVIGLTKSVALEYAKQRIRVNAVAPGAIETRMYFDFAATPEIRQQLEAAHPIARIGQLEEVARAVLWLCSDAASFVTGQTLAVDGGHTVQ